MLFYTPEFLAFSLVLLAALAVVTRDEPRKLVLLVASYAFYMAWNPAFVLLIGFSTGVDYFVGRRLAVCEDPRQRRHWLWLSLLSNLGLLGFFKYAGFFSENALWLMRAFGYEPHWTTLEILLPVGISFYTFQSMSYTIDVYRRQLEPTRSPIDFALFVAFFPTLVAGPIVRARDFLPQLRGRIELGCDQQTLFLILRGLVKKVLIADNVAVFADAVFADPGRWPSLVVMIGALAFTVQLYCDFSGYSDMAIGMARILGFRIPLNFDHPFMARNPSEIWHRWHVSLSSWLRDYVYIPLGGNRAGAARTHLNLMATMVIGGLWHGASWNFVIWGFLHGAALVLHRLYSDARRALSPDWQPSSHPLVAALCTMATFAFWALTLVVFRVRDLDALGDALSSLLFFDGRFALQGAGLGAQPFFTALLLLAIFFALHAFSIWRGTIDAWLGRMPLPAAIAACVTVGFVAFFLWPLGEAPFIYFQF